MHLACVSNQIHCIDWPRSNVVRTYQPTPACSAKIRSASWANTAGWMCVVTCHGQVEVVSFKYAQTKFLHRIEGVRDARYGTFHSLNKRDIAIARGDSILIYDVKRGYVKKVLGPSSDHSEYFKVLPGSKDEYLCAAAGNNQINVFDALGSTATLEASNTGSLVNFALNDRFGLKVAACTDQGACVLWELDGMTNIYNEPTKCPIRDLVLRDNSILYVTEDGQCVMRDSYNTSTIGRFHLRYVPKCIDMCTDGVSFAVCDDHDTIYGYDVRNLAMPTSRVHLLEGDRIVQITFCKHEPLAEGDSASFPTLATSASQENTASKIEDIRVVHEFNSSSDTHADYSKYSADLCYPSTANYDFCSVSETQDSGPPTPPKENLNGETVVAPPTVNLSFEVAELVRAAVRDGIDEVKKDIKSQMQKAVVDATKSNFFELRMALVKEFIKIQEILDKLQQTKTSSRHDLT